MFGIITVYTCYQVKYDVIRQYVIVDRQLNHLQCVVRSAPALTARITAAEAVYSYI